MQRRKVRFAERVHPNAKMLKNITHAAKILPQCIHASVRSRVARPRHLRLIGVRPIFCPSTATQKRHRRITPGQESTFMPKGKRPGSQQEIIMNTIIKSLILASALVSAGLVSAGQAFAEEGNAGSISQVLTDSRAAFSAQTTLRNTAPALANIPTSQIIRNSGVSFPVNTQNLSQGSTR
jgi:hypothetical protein